MSGARPRRPRYAGEDLRPTSDRELWGWYAYTLAAEVYAVCGVGSFLPVTLEQLSRERGVLRSDGTTSCVDASATTATRDLIGRDDDGQCIVQVLGMEVSTSSFAMYTTSIAVLIQALTIVSVSAIADHGANRKRLLLTLAFIGSISSMLFIFVSPTVFMAAPILVVIGATCLGSSFVLLNSFLPLLVMNHPSIIQDVDDQSDDANNQDALPMTQMSAASAERDSIDFDRINEHTAAQSVTAFAQARSNHMSPELQLSNQISSKAVGVGYSSAVFVQIISIVILVIINKFAPPISKTTLPLRIVLFLVGFWWLAFTLPVALWLRRRPGPPLPSSIFPSIRILCGRAFSWISYVLFAWTSLFQTAKLALRLPQVILFLIAWFVISDAIATVSGTAILFARTELHMGTASTAVVSVAATAAGIAGAFAWPPLARRWCWDQRRVIVANIFLFEIIPLYGLCGFLPFVKSWGVGGLQQPWEIFPLAIIHGISMGGLSSHCRSCYGLLLPPGKEAAFFALYAFTDKGSSVIGPAIVGKIVDSSGSIRPSFWFLAVLILIPVPLVLRLDVEKGRKEGVVMAERLLQGLKGIRDGDIGDTESRDLRSDEHEELLAENDER
ncbi:autophagy-related protein 22-like protein [Lineolata rhizophorae]|uniref:Autophagy-related protein n=1 Tax=Lineolata rhizophorae TaxID=578093 RepID=A0A6A6P2L3_9PEZI|nr:autophagy-related protein 22-like protein [Lineolata rhizophorae]